jgi:hypothetical protein
MNKIWKAVSLVGLVVLSIGATSIAYAQTESPQPYSNPGYGPGMMGGKGRYGVGMVDGGLGLFHDALIESFADVLGLTASQLESRLESGETMWQVVEAEGISWEEYSVIMQDARSAALDQAVEDGTITQEQADFMNSRGQARGYARGKGGCMGSEYGAGQRGPQGRWNAP